MTENTVHIEEDHFLICSYLLIYCAVITISLYMQCFVSEKWSTLVIIIVGMIVSAIFNLSGGYNKPIKDNGFDANYIGFNPR